MFSVYKGAKHLDVWAMHRSGLPFSHINIQVSRIRFSKIPDQLLGLPLHDRGSKPIGCVITCLMSSKHGGLFNWALEAKKKQYIGFSGLWFIY